MWREVFIENCLNDCRPNCSLNNNQIAILEYVHSETIIHRDLKLENILLGIDSGFFRIHLIDFGLSKRYIDPQTNKHIPMKSGKTLLGSVEYASVNNHNGKELSRRDDIEALAYILCHLILGELPWSNLVGEDKGQDNESRVCTMKQKFQESEAYKTLPIEFKTFLEASKALGFEDEPKYLEYRRIFKELMIREGFSFDYIYDWILLPVSKHLTSHLNAVDDLLQIEDNLTKEEEEEIATLMQRYEQDPTVLDFRLEEIKKQNKKFDVISPQGSPRNSALPEEKGKQGKKGKDDGATDAAGKGGKGGKDKKDRDCTLI